MGRPGDYYTKWNKSDRESQIAYDTAYMWNLKKKIHMDLFIKQKHTHRHRKWIYSYQGQVIKWSGEMGMEFGIDMYTLLHLKQITNKYILYQNSVQYSVIT